MIDEEGESDTESDDITEAEKKFKCLLRMKRWPKKFKKNGKLKRKRKKQGNNADKILAEELQKEEREKFTIEQRAKFLHDTIVATKEMFFLTKDERQIMELNKDPKKKRVIKETPREEDTAKVPAEQEVIKHGTKKRKSGHVKMIARKRPRPQPDDGSDDEQ
ncbi:hypothetical protein Tco_1021304 [Tanacetum coccineum]